MKQGSILFLKIVVLLIGTGILAVLLFVLPEMASRNAVQDPEIAYLKYPFIIYSYIAALPFFIALYQGLKLLNHIEKKRVFTEVSVGFLRYIKYCAIITCLLIISGTLYVIFFITGDRAGIIGFGIYSTFATVVCIVVVAVLQKLLQNAVVMKIENDLTV